MLKDRVGSVRSQAASRYEVTPVELVAAMAFPHPRRPHGKLDEDALAEALAVESGIPYLKIDPLRIDNDLVTKTLSRPFARHHVVIPVAREGDTLCLTLTDPFDTTLRQSLEDLIQAPLTYVVTAKSDVLQVIDRVYGFRAKVSKAETELGGGNTSALVQLVEVRSNDELATAQNDEHVIAAVDYLLNYAFEQRASDIHLEPRRRRCGDPLSDRRHPARHRDGFAIGARCDYVPHQGTRGHEHRRPAPPAGRPHQDPARAARGRTARVEFSDRLRSEGRDPRIRSQRPARRPPRPRLQRRRTRALRALDHLPQRA